MNNNKVELLIVLDGSGSMSTIKSVIEKGFNEFLVKQKQVSGECLVTLVEFSDQWKIIFEAKPIQQVDGIVVTPTGGTALNDALCGAIDHLGRRLDFTPEQDRPAKVLVYVLTDGQENSSRKYTNEDVKRRLDTQQKQFNWDVTFLGCGGQDSIAVGNSIGISATNSFNFGTSSVAVSGAFSVLSNKAAYYRSAVDSSTVSNYVFSDVERKMSEDK